MDIRLIAKAAERLIVDNSTTVLTTLAVGGVVTTAILTGKASIKANEILRETHSEDMPVAEKAAMTWKLYIPASIAGAATIASIVGVNRIGTRRAAAVAAAYSLSEKAFAEYKERVVEKFGANKEQAVQDEVAQQRVSNNPVSEREVFITGSGDVLCYDSYTGRYFNSTMETLKRAQNEINAEIINASYASLSEFYSLIGLPKVAFSDEVGWTTDKLLELSFSTVLSEDDRPCLSVNFVVAPVRNFYRADRY